MGSQAETGYIRSNLAELRFSNGRLSQRQVSEATGIGQKTLSALETGASKGIEFNTLVKLCNFFGCDPGDLLVVEEAVEDIPPSKEALKKADEIIARGLKKAMSSPAKTTEQIWTQFDSACKRMREEVAPSKKRRKKRA